MDKKITLALLAALVVCSCSEKKETQKVQPVKVSTETVGAEGVTSGETYTGTVEEMNGVSLSFSVGGTLKQLLVDEGQTVRSGQLIAVTDGQDASNAVELSEASVRSAQTAYNQAQDAYKRMKMIHDNGSLPDIKWVEAQSNVDKARAALEGARAQARIAGKGLSDTRLYAPFSGYISHKAMEIGQTVAPGQAVVNLVRIDEVKVKISVPETEISHLSNGTTVSIRVDALGGRTYTGRIVEKGVSADPLSHTYEVKALVRNGDGKLLPGMIAEVSVPGIASSSSSASYQSAATTLPAGVIQLDADNRTFVWTVVGGRAKKTYVTTGSSIGNLISVTDGLHSGHKVIVSGQQKVSSGMAVTE